MNYPPLRAIALLSLAVPALGPFWDGASMLAHFQRVSDALSVAKDGGRLLFRGGDYSEAVTLDLGLVVESICGAASFGD